MEDELTTGEAAKLLGVQPRQVRWYFENQLLPGRMIAGRLVFPRAAVEAFEKPKKSGRPPKHPPASGKPSKPAAGPKAGKGKVPRTPKRK